MDFEPPRADKKYSKTLEFQASRFHQWAMFFLPDSMKPEGASLSLLPFIAAGFSLIPGLGSFYLDRKVLWPLAQFGAWMSMVLFFFFTFGTPSGTFLAMALFSFHQYLMYRCYLQGLKAGKAPLPGLWKGLWISLLMALLLGSAYFALDSPLQNRLFYAQRSLGNLIQEGDRFGVASEGEYRPGEVVIFNRELYYRHSPREGAGMVERILAKPGDRVEWADGKLLVNGQALPEGSGPLESGLSYPGPTMTVPDGDFLVMYQIQTNRAFNPDWYLVKKEDIRGRLALRYSPTWQWLP